MDILDILVDIRKQKKIRQINLAIFLKVNTLTISRYENKKRKMPYDMLIKYADFLGYELKLQIQ